MIAQLPWLCWVTSTGKTAPGALPGLLRRSPSPDAPAVIGAGAGAARREVDLLLPVLSRISAHEIAGQPVEREPPGVPQSIGLDLWPRSAAREEWVARRNRVTTVRPRADTQNLPVEHGRVLPEIPRIALAAAIADADIEVAVRAELKLPAVVVVLAMAHGEHDPGTGWIRTRGCTRGGTRRRGRRYQGSCSRGRDDRCADNQVRTSSTAALARFRSTPRAL